MLVIYKYFEKEFYIISNSGGEKIRSKSSNYASSICNLMYFLEVKLKTEGFRKVTKEEVGFSASSYKPKSFGLNIGNIGNQFKNTVEFRIPNGTLEYDTLNENIILFGSLMKTSKDIADFPEYQLEVNNLLSEKRTDQRRMDMLMNMLFDKDESNKNIYYNRYDYNCNDSMLNNLGLTKTTLNDYPTIKKALSKKN